MQEHVFSSIIRPGWSFPDRHFNVLMEVDPERHEMWIRLQSGDAVNIRDSLSPGTHVGIFGVVSAYQASGGYPIVEADPTPGLPSYELMRDRFQLSTSSLKLVISAKEAS